MSISQFVQESSNIQYQGYSTMGKMTTKNETDGGSGIMSHIDDFQIIATSAHTILPYIYFQECTS